MRSVKDYMNGIYMLIIFGILETNCQARCKVYGRGIDHSRLRQEEQTEGAGQTSPAANSFLLHQMLQRLPLTSWCAQPFKEVQIDSNYGIYTIISRDGRMPIIFDSVSVQSAREWLIFPTAYQWCGRACEEHGGSSQEKFSRRWCVSIYSCISLVLPILSN